LQTILDQVVDFFAWYDDLEASVGHGETCERGSTSFLCLFGVVVLGGESAVGRNPLLRVMRLLQGVADTGVTCSKDAITTTSKLRAVERHVHQLVHVLEDEHVTVKLNDTLILSQTEGSKLAPAIVEARVVAVVLGHGRQQVGNTLGRNAASLESGMALGRECVGVESDKRVLAAGSFQRVVESQQAREIICVCD